MCLLRKNRRLIRHKANRAGSFAPCLGPAVLAAAHVRGAALRETGIARTLRRQPALATRGLTRRRCAPAARGTEPSPAPPTSHPDWRWVCKLEADARHDHRTAASGRASPSRGVGARSRPKGATPARRSSEARPPARRAAGLSERPREGDARTAAILWWPVPPSARFRSSRRKKPCYPPKYVLEKP